MESKSSVDFFSKPLAVIVIGMAGSGKTSFVKALKEYLSKHDLPAYTINMDPAVHFLPYDPNIDIRDVVNYKEVMKEYNLGPNGSILTSLNLFSTKMNDVVELISNNSGATNHCIIDTPGQIEVFKWSASGKIITETLASSFPTVILYVIDSTRSTNPRTFVSNMAYASAVATEYDLPFVMAMNKIDIIDCQYLEDWMADVTRFIDDMEDQDLGYMSSVTRQMGFVLEKFYSIIPKCGISSQTGQGMEELVGLLKAARDQFLTEYLTEILPARSSDTEEQLLDGNSQFLDLLSDRLKKSKEDQIKTAKENDEVISDDGDETD